MKGKLDGKRKKMFLFGERNKENDRFNKREGDNGLRNSIKILQSWWFSCIAEVFFFIGCSIKIGIRK